MARIVIGCRLPSGLILTHPVSKEKVTIDGLHKAKIIGATHTTTEIDADFWASWKTAYADYAPLKNGAIFEARNETEAIAKSKEFRKEKTGLEPLAQDAHGVKPDKGK